MILKRPDTNETMLISGRYGVSVTTAHLETDIQTPYVSEKRCMLLTGFGKSDDNEQTSCCHNDVGKVVTD